MAALFRLILTKRLSLTVFIVTQVLILTISLIFLTFLYYILNKDILKPSKQLEDYSPVSSKVASLILEINQPDDNTLTFDQDLFISGKTLPNLKILISTSSQDFIIEAKKDGTFSTILELNEGVNYIEAHVFDARGDQRMAERTVFYSKERI